MKKINTELFKKAYYSVDDQANFTNRDKKNQKKVLFDLDSMPDTEDAIKAKWESKSKSKSKSKKKKKTQKKEL